MTSLRIALLGLVTLVGCASGESGSEPDTDDESSSGAGGGATERTYTEGVTSACRLTAYSTTNSVSLTFAEPGATCDSSMGVRFNSDGALNPPVFPGGSKT